MKKKPLDKVNKLILYVLLTIFAVVSLLPLYWVFSTSLQLKHVNNRKRWSDLYLMSIPIHRKCIRWGFHFTLNIGPKRATQ